VRPHQRIPCRRRTRTPPRENPPRETLGSPRREGAHRGEGGCTAAQPRRRLRRRSRAKRAGETALSRAPARWSTLRLSNTGPSGASRGGRFGEEVVVGGRCLGMVHRSIRCQREEAFDSAGVQRAGHRCRGSRQPPSQEPLCYLPATAKSALGFVRAIVRSVRAAPLGCFRPCSQPCRVRTDTPSSAAN